MRIELNLNDQCEVVLTAYGAAQYNHHYDLPLSARVAPVVAGQTLRLPLWELCNVWGGLMFNGQRPERMPFERNIVALRVAIGQDSFKLIERG